MYLFCMITLKIHTMKQIKVSPDKARQTLNTLDMSNLSEVDIEVIISKLLAASPATSPWWVILLKVLAYAIGLIVAGYSTTATAMSLFI